MIQHYLSKSRRILSQSENHFSDNEISIIETKMDEMKVLKNKMKESQDKTRDVTKTFEKAIPTQNHKPKILKLDEYFDQENDIYLPEVPSEILEPKKADLVYRDEEIERRLTKLKFFNQTWLNDAIKTRPTKSKTYPEVPSGSHDTIDDNEEVTMVEVGHNKELTSEPILDLKVLKTEPFYSTKEDAEAFNDWYYKHISESKSKQPSKAFSSASTDNIMPILNKQVVVNPRFSMWKVDIDVVIVLMITLISFIPKFPIMKSVPISRPTSSAVAPTSPIVCKTTKRAESVLKTEQSVTTSANHGNLKIPVWQGKFWQF